jgi:hypothetical protein
LSYVDFLGLLFVCDAESYTHWDPTLYGGIGGFVDSVWYTCTDLGGGGGGGPVVSAGSDLAVNSATPFYKNPCIQKALAKGAVTAGLDAIGLLPEGGAVAAAFSLFHGAAGVSNGTKILGRVAVGGALISTGVSLSDASGPDGGVASFAGLQTGVNVLGLAKSLFEAIPIAGQAIAVASVGLDIYGTIRDIRQCH